MFTQDDLTCINTVLGIFASLPSIFVNDSDHPGSKRRFGAAKTLGVMGLLMFSVSFFRPYVHAEVDASSPSFSLDAGLGETCVLETEVDG